MIEQLSLDDLPLHRTNDPDTSKEAAKIAKRAQTANCQRVLAYLRSIWPQAVNDYDMAAALGGQQCSLGCRRKDLTRAGYVEYAGVKTLSPSGSPSQAWRAVGSPSSWVVDTGTGGVL